MALEEYRAKRDFTRTEEPAPGEARPRSGPLTFVVQKHAARRLHYDFRLEVDGVLKSWPIPNGPSYTHGERRLAVMTEDHPLDYATFEGVIPKGEYGGGQVIVWDAGIYAPEEHEKPCYDRERAEELVRQGIKRGRLTVFLHGRKLRGAWSLVHTQDKNWLFLKKDDSFADPNHDVVLEDASVLSGLTIEDLKDGRLPPKRHTSLVLDPADTTGARPSQMLRNLSPMLPTLRPKAFSNPNWLFEPKLDGYRVLATVEGREVRLASRRGLDCSNEYPWLLEALRQQPYHDAIFDGEIVALDEQGRPSFQLLQNRGSEPRPVLLYYAFDLLYRDGFDLRGVPLEQRKQLLSESLIPADRVRVVDTYPEDGLTLFAAVRSNGLEGIVAKRRDSRYETGRRTDAWVKIKATHSQEFVVGGYTAGSGTRERTFGSLVVGYYKKGARKLTYVGHAGSGFDDKTLKTLYERLQPLRASESPFTGDVPTMGMWRRPGKADGPITWVKPELVAQVKYAEITQDGIMRAPVFLGLREDKAARDVVGLEEDASLAMDDGDAAAPAPGARDDASAPAAGASNDRGAPAAGASNDARGPAPGASSDARAPAAGTRSDPGITPSLARRDARSAAIATQRERDRAVSPGDTDAAQVELADVIERLRNHTGEKLTLRVEGNDIAFSNLNKVFWPAHGEQRTLTKRDLVLYFAHVAQYQLPHLRDRPLTLVRFPNGIHGGHFYQKHYEQPTPGYVETVWLWSDHNKGDGEYLLINNLSTLLWLGQLADIELHTWYSRVDPNGDAEGIPTTFAGSLENMQQSVLNYPDFIVFDLDPYLYSGKEARGAEPELHPEGFAATSEVALQLKTLLDSLGVASFVKTTGRTGLHIYVPIVRNLDYHATHALSEALARYLEQQYPKTVTTEWAVDKRKGKVFVDYNQNVRGKTLGSIYSPRVLPWAAVSMPLRWDEVGGSVFPTDFTILTAPERLAQVGDLWAPILESKHDLAKVLEAVTS